MIGANTHGAPTWLDLSTSDVEATVDFYSGLLGWTVTRRPSPFGTYAIGAIGEVEVGGMMEPVPVEGMPAVWTVFFAVSDVDASVATIQRIGGSVLQPAFDLTDARIAVVADPTGAMLGLLSGTPAQSHYLDQRPGTMRWVELLTRDPAAAETFYAEVFGWKAETSEGEGTSYTIFTLDGDAVAGMMLMPAEVPAEVPAYWSAYYLVDDAAATAARATELGGTVIVAPTEIDGDRFAILEDPQGAVFGVLQPADAAT